MKIQTKNVLNTNYVFSKNNDSRKENSFVVSNSMTSSLDVLSSYGKAQVSFKGNEKVDYKKKLHNFAYKLLEENNGKSDNLPYGCYSLAEFLSVINYNNIDLAEKLCFGRDEKGKRLFDARSYIYLILTKTNGSNIEFADKLCFGKDDKGKILFEHDKHIPFIIGAVNNKNIGIAEKLCFSKNEKGYSLFQIPSQIAPILDSATEYKEDFIEKLCYGKDKFGRQLFSNKYIIFDIVSRTTEDNLPLAKRLCYEQDEFGQQVFPEKKEISKIIAQVDSLTFDIAEKMCFAKDKYGDFIFPDRDAIAGILVATDENNIKDVENLVQKAIEGKIQSYIIPYIVNEDVTLAEFENAKSIIGEEKLSKYLAQDEVNVIKVADLFGKQKIEDIPFEQRNDILKKIISINSDLFDTAKRVKKDFPLLPQNREEYCKLLKDIVATIGVETKSITNEQQQDFYLSINSLSQELKTLTDEEYNNLSIKLSYPKDKFIEDIKKVLVGVNSEQKQEVTKYFGFELEKNEKAKTGFSIVGYPLNIENREKIQNKNTNELIEQIRPFVVRFSENNKVVSNNKQVENSLNEILTVFPELYPMVGKQQHATHSFDVFKHSLKVMQKIVQTIEFEGFNESDKKILLIASLLHDVAKVEGKAASIHAITGAFDSFYLFQKLNLTKDEKIKLYSLIKEHEWLGNINKLSDEEKILNQKKSTAYDLHYGNLFELAKVFTQADLKAVKDNDSFYLHHQKAFENISKDVESYISQLKNTQPLLPVTKFPKASRIKDAITVVNKDYSTNLKGIYQDDKGMVIIKFNEVENETWEKIGFPKGSFSKGVTATGYYRKNNVVSSSEYDTGNIKFFVHGFDRAEQLANFNAFELPDSDALLSVSYAERPESKYRFFRHKGLILNADAKYIHGGGKSDSGSGYTKNIDMFKQVYAFEGCKKHEDRKFISDLIKQELNLSNEEYLEFVKNNANKPISEIEPKEAQIKLIQALATINSKTRHGDRNYNEMFLSNPEIMGVYSYCNSIAFKPSLHGFIYNQPDFIKDYALNNDLPFVVFGELED